MDKIITPTPSFARAGVTPGWDKLKVVDAKSGKQIDGVVEADAAAGRVVRRDLDEQGNLQIDGDAIKLVTEERAIRIKWASDPDERAPVLDAEAAIVAPPPAVVAG